MTTDTRWVVRDPILNTITVPLTRAQAVAVRRRLQAKRRRTFIIQAVRNV